MVDKDTIRDKNLIVHVFAAVTSSHCNREHPQIYMHDSEFRKRLSFHQVSARPHIRNISTFRNLLATAFSKKVDLIGLAAAPRGKCRYR